MKSGIFRKELAETYAGPTYSEFPMVISQCALADNSERRRSP